MRLREEVTVHGPMGNTPAELFIGYGGLPQIDVYGLYPWGEQRYSLATFPAAWTIYSPTCGDLYTAWQEIEAVMRRLREAEQEAEADDRDRAEQRAIDNRIAQELDHCDERKETP